MLLPTHAHTQEKQNFKASLSVYRSCRKTLLLRNLAAQAITAFSVFK